MGRSVHGSVQRQFMRFSCFYPHAYTEKNANEMLAFFLVYPFHWSSKCQRGIKQTIQLRLPRSFHWLSLRLNLNKIYRSFFESFFVLKILFEMLFQRIQSSNCLKLMLVLCFCIIVCVLCSVFAWFANVQNYDFFKSCFCANWILRVSGVFDLQNSPFESLQ